MFTIRPVPGHRLFGLRADHRRGTGPQAADEAPVSAEAVQQRNWLVGAEIANIGHNFKLETFTLDVAPRAWFFVSDNAVLGFASSADIDTGNASTGLSLGLGLQVYLPGRNN